MTDPGLLDIRAIVSTGGSIEGIAYQIISAVRPDILSRINSKMRRRILDRSLPVEKIDPKLIVSSPRRREKLTRRDLSRIRLLHGIFLTYSKTP